MKYDGLPPYMVDAARDYVEHGIEPETRDFLYELLTNDLFGVFKFGDDTNLAHLHAWMMWLYNEPPSACWGSIAKVDAWCERCGLDRKKADE